ncbi:MAG: RNA polymerase sporulation sigma factor SigK [Lachnospiraceae bacterium]|nr:RNA polymerase sporulation sigma factor SigK [Lachnospiraceae bacterium]
MKTFKQPLSPEEEKCALARYKEGDMAARNLLIEHNLRLVAHIAKKYQSPELDSDDLLSIGIIGLIKAVMTFDSEKNARLGTYAARCIENELLMMLRARKKLTHETSMYEKIGTDQEGRDLRLMDVLESEPIDVIEDLETQKNIRRMRACMGQILSERERRVLAGRYGLDGQKERTQREIAAVMGISRSYVSRLEKRALEKMRQALQEG